MAEVKLKIKKFFSNKFNLALLVVLLAGGFLRIYNLNHLYYYTMDEEVMNLIQRRIVLGIHFPLIGSVSPLGTYLGPITYYIGALILGISKLNPLGQGYFAALLGTFNIFLIFYVGKELFGKKVGLWAAIFYSFSFLMILFDRRYWQLTWGPFLSLLVLLSIFKVKKGNLKFVYLLIGALILGFNSDYTNLALFLFTAVCWIIFKLPIRKREVGIALIIFLLSLFPLILFDLRHNFLNTKAFIGYFTHHNQNLNEGVNVSSVTSSRESLGKTNTDEALISAMVPIYGFSRLIYVSSDSNISEQHTYCKEYIRSRDSTQGPILLGFSFLLILAFLLLAYQRRDSREGFSFKLVALFYLIFQIGILGYAFLLHGDVFEHYLSTLLPYFFLMMATLVAVAWVKKWRVLIGLLTAVYIIFNVKTTLTAYNPYSFEDKLEAANWAINQVGSNDFSLDSIGSCYRYDGFYYPFIYLGKHPTKSYQDSNYSWLYDYSVAKTDPSKIVVMSSPGRFSDQNFYQIYNRYQKWVIDRKTFGGIEVLIVDNSEGEFR